jgi:formate C-acetyltransferase
LNALVDRQIAMIDRIEREYPHLHAAPFLSSTLESAMEKGGDAYMKNAARYCNSSINAMGLATVVDSLYAIKRLVYDENTVTLAQLKAILAANWEGAEELRTLVKRRFPKFGMAEAETDEIARRVMEAICRAICRRPNAKGGTYRLSTFSIDYRWQYGKKLGATADGRLCGEPFSQNADASFGGDRGGATAQLLSVTNAIDAEETPNGTVVDIDLHESAIKGENGLHALHSLLRAYFSRGGFAVHYNVLRTDVLEAARKHPEDYPNLQVRLCGWNAKFIALSEREQEELIARAKK